MIAPRVPAAYSSVRSSSARPMPRGLGVGPHDQHRQAPDGLAPQGERDTGQRARLVLGGPRTTGIRGEQPVEPGVRRPCARGGGSGIPRRSARSANVAMDSSWAAANVGGLAAAGERAWRHGKECPGSRALS